MVRMSYFRGFKIKTGSRWVHPNYVLFPVFEVVIEIIRLLVL